MDPYPRPMGKLIGELSKLPGIGPKTARRLSFYILERSKNEVKELADALLEAREKINYCSVCNHLTENDKCSFCSSESRDQSMICVVESPRDIVVMEKTGEYNGLYHVLHGAISPMDGIGPDEIKIRSLIPRLENGVEEVIIATDPNAEGDATAMYLAKLIKPLGVKVTRIAHGVPVGGDLEYADEVTLSKALEGRREL
ncbi:MULTISPECIES: recombination mediator RecR [unclassified Halanaerobium]|uniref:recombination mediator RecR n=1 Tax=unclassified Halanaerobium TaxID=2641197 RepID=UPI000DF4064C|nr:MULTISPECIES: recombination mediator RecR [unclassified Halanaerobium]RCW50721.1 DNA replication and repair protein RecR [Halanaerobium sp. MA284_MarDTE_T2]RCW86890.1 DNA replication and repair protein RecR [Halanaerobium sp. DL-01]